MSMQFSSPTLVPQSVPTVSGEADHRIANSLAGIASLVRVRAAKGNSADDPETFLTEIADRIDTVAKLHRLVAHSNTGAVQLSKYLQEICERLSSALAAPEATSFSVDCPPEQIVPFTMALPLGLITAELFSNSLKYAHPAGTPLKVTLSCCRAEDGMRIVYEDDGVGFPEGFDITHDGHLGMTFIRLLSEQLKGTPEWRSDPLGIRFEMVVPAIGSE
jgi:two-component sensor histidine kinase